MPGVPDWTMAEDVRLATLENEHLGMLSAYVVHDWPSAQAEDWKELQPYRSSRDKIVIIDGIAMKSRIIIIPTSLQIKALK